MCVRLAKDTALDPVEVTVLEEARKGLGGRGIVLAAINSKAE
jgi:hypothetical protein